MRGWWIPCLAASCLYEARPIDSDPDAPMAPPDADPSARVTDGLVGLWLLDATAGAVVADSSGLTPPVDLAIAAPTDVVWSNGALTIEAPVDINTGFGVTNRLVPAWRASDQLTVEAWVTPTATTQTGTTPGQPARVMTLTVENIASHQFCIGQLDGAWTGQVRTDAAGLDAHGGSPMLVNGTVALALTHLVLTSTPTERRLYVDGVAVADDRGGLLDHWENMRSLALGGDPNRRNTWLGTIHLAAAYDRALSDAEIMTNFRAGPGP